MTWLSLEQAALEEAGDDLAAVLVSAFRHDARRDQEMPTAAFAKSARARGCGTRAGAALILDDVRAGLPLDLAGSWEPLGVRPDLSGFSKAIANGYALAAVTGNDRFRAAARLDFRDGLLLVLGPMSMAAAIATLTKLSRDRCGGAYGA